MAVHTMDVEDRLLRLRRRVGEHQDGHDYRLDYIMGYDGDLDNDDDDIVKDLGEAISLTTRILLSTLSHLTTYTLSRLTTSKTTRLLQDIQSACHYADTHRLTLLLSSVGPELIDQMVDGETLLMGACRDGFGEVVRLLVEAGADVAARTAAGGSPLSFAVRGGHPHILPLLLLHYKDHPTDYINDPADPSGRTPLHWAAVLGTIDSIRILLAHGASIHARDRSGSTPLMLAAAEGHPDAAEAIIDSVPFRQDIPALVNAKNEVGYTALHHTLLRLSTHRPTKHTITLRLLLRHAASPLIGKVGGRRVAGHALVLLRMFANLRLIVGAQEVMGELGRDVMGLVVQQVCDLADDMEL